MNPTTNNQEPLGGEEAKILADQVRVWTKERDRLNDLLAAAQPKAEPLGGDPSYIEQIIACLGDDAATLEATNPDDEIAQNMREAAKILEALSQQAGAAGASEVKTWQERYGSGRMNDGAWPHVFAEIADLRAQLARQRQGNGEPVAYLYEFIGQGMGLRQPGDLIARTPKELGGNIDLHPDNWKRIAPLYTLPAAQAQGEPVAWAVIAERGGIHKLAITRESAERKQAKWLEEWPNNKCQVRPLVFGDGPAAQADEVRDTERLDFLETLAARNDDAMPSVRAFGKTFVGETLRDAIDTALRTTAADNQKGGAA